MIRKSNQTIPLLFAAILLMSLWSCNPSAKYEKEEASMIQEYLASNLNLNFIKQASGLYYLEVLLGSGPLSVKSDTAYVMYTGMFLDGTVFDTNVGSTDTLIFPVNEGWAIAGFDEGITLMREGGEAMFLIPSNLAYGTSGFYFIPGYTPLLYDIELVRLKPGPGK